MLIVAGLLLLSGCGIPSNPEDGPVVLLCEGVEVTTGADGDSLRERKHEFYRVNGVDHTIATWDDSSQSFGFGLDGLNVSPTELRYSREYPTLAGITSTKTVTFDRVTGRVVDETLFSNGGMIAFNATCRPVEEPTEAMKF